MTDTSTALTTTASPCKALTKHGEPCRAYACTGSQYCYHHDPERSAARAAARSKGGKARHGRTLAGRSPDAPLQVGDDCSEVDLINAALDVVWGLEASIAKARTLGYLAGQAIAARRNTDLEERMAAFEQWRKDRG